jgi:hypothetical protein
MKFLKILDKKMLTRLGVSLMLAVAALGMFIMSRSTLKRPVEVPKKELSKTVAADIDRDVEAVLAKFKIERGWIRKSAIPLPNTTVIRIERRVAIPTDVVPLQMNVALNNMAKQYNGRAIASENVKENSVTIHIEMDGYVVQTIILKTDPDLKRSGQKDGQKKV